MFFRELFEQVLNEKGGMKKNLNDLVEELDNLKIKYKLEDEKTISIKINPITSMNFNIPGKGENYYLKNKIISSLGKCKSTETDDFANYMKTFQTTTNNFYVTFYNNNGITTSHNNLSIVITFLNKTLNEQWEEYSFSKKEMKEFDNFLKDIYNKYKNFDGNYIYIKKLSPEETFGPRKLYFYKDFYIDKLYWNWILTYNVYDTEKKLRKRHFTDENIYGGTTNGGKKSEDLKSAIDTFKQHILDHSEID